MSNNTEQIFLAIVCVYYDNDTHSQQLVTGTESELYENFIKHTEAINDDITILGVTLEILTEWREYRRFKVHTTERFKIYQKEKMEVIDETEAN